MCAREREGEFNESIVCTFLDNRFDLHSKSTKTVLHIHEMLAFWFNNITYAWSILAILPTCATITLRKAERKTNNFPLISV